MRFLVLFACACIAIGLDGCGGSKRKLEQSFPAGEAPTASNDAGVNVRITHYKQSDHYLIVNMTITNNGTDEVQIHNGDGNSLPSFQANIDGAVHEAERRGHGSWNPWTGYEPRPGVPWGDIELPPGNTAGIEIRWDCSASRKDYAWTVTLRHLESHDHKLGDISITYPSGGDRR